MPNTPPSLTDFAADVTFSEDAVNAAPVLIDADVTFTDAEGDFAGGMLILSGLLFEDRVGIRNEGTAPGEIGVSGTDVSYGGVVIGTVAGGVGASLSVTFNAAATPAAVDALIQNLTFADVSDTPIASRLLRLDIVDAGGAHVTSPFNVLTGGANPFGAVTSSGDSASAFADLDNDGLADVVVGQFSGTLRVYHNEGNGTFTQRIGAANPFNGVTGAYLAPAFADLDGDGKLDAVVGMQNGTLRAFHNNGNGTFSELVGGANPFNGVRVDHDATPSYFAKPGFVDLDGDGRLDAVVGESYGQLLAFHNNGDGTFTRLTGAANPFNGVDVGDRSAPSFVDLDGDGKLDAVVGEYEGTMLVFHNNGDGTFTPLVGAANPFEGIDVGARATPTFGDLDGDGRLDALVGDFDGTLLAFHNNTPVDPTITVTVTAVNDAPVSGGPGTASGTEDDASIGGTVPAASDIDSPALTYSLVAGSVKVNNVTVADATVTVNSDGTYSYATGAADQALDGTGTRVITFDYVANDGSENSAAATVTVTVNGANDAPAAAATNNVTTNEDSASSPIAIGATDVDGDTLSYTVNASGLPTRGSVTFNQGAGTFTYTPPLNENGSDSFIIDIDDGHSGVTQQTVTVTINAINDGPVLAGFAPSIIFAANVVNTTPQLLDGDVTLTDAEGNFNGGTLIVSGLLAEDEVTIRDQGTGAGQIGVAGTDISYGGTTIGSFAGGAGATLTVTLNADATAAAVDALIQNLTYANDSDTPTPSRTLALNVTDADGGELGPLPVPASFAQLFDAANPLGGFATGGSAKPCFVDLDDDGDLDAVAGSLAGPLRTFQNEGGAFIELTGAANPFGGVDVGIRTAPGFADLDGDLDLDLVVGNSQGNLHVFENIGGAFIELTGGANPFNGVDVGLISAPSFVDLDGDDDLDLVVGNNDRMLRTFENDAGAFTELAGTANPFNGVDVGYYSTPGFVDLDGDGDPDLVVGNNYGQLRTFENTGGTFTELTGAANPFDGVDVGDISAPTFVDLDDDGDMDAVVGNYNGALLAFDNLTPHGQAIVVNVALPNEAPSGSNATVGFNEDAVRILRATDFGFGDGDGNAFAAVTIDSTAGGTIRFDADGSGGDAPEVQTLPQTFTAADLAAGKVTFVPDADLNGTGAASLIFRVQDDGGTAYGGIDTDPSANTLTFDIAAVNDGPRLSGFAADITFSEGAVNAAPVLIDGDVVLTDPEDNIGGGTLTVSGLLAEDVVAIRNQGTGAGQIDVSGADISYEGTVIGSFVGGDGATFTVTFDAAATAASVDALIQNLTYANESDTPTPSRTLVLNVTDADGGDLGPLPVPATFAPLIGAANPLDFVQVYFASSPSGLSSPGFVDLDGDGDPDLVVGDNFGSLFAFQNEGGVFTELAGATNPFDGVYLGDSAAPGFVDLDGDGDLDMVVGVYDGTLHVLENDGGVFTELTGTANPFDGVDIGDYASPGFVDLDGDSDLDMVVGEKYGHLRTFENDGGAFTELTGAMNPFDGVTVGSHAAPSFVDLDGDGDLDLVVGNFSGPLSAFENEGGAFTELTGAANPFNFLNVGLISTPRFVDIDIDGDMDAVVGNSEGRLRVFENLTPHGREIVVNITATDDPSVAKDDSFATNEATAIVAGNLFADNGSGPDTDIEGTMTIAAVNGSAGHVGTQFLLASGALLTVQTNGTYSYDPNHAFDDLPAASSGASNLTDNDSFTYTLANGNSATVTITLSGLDSADRLLGTSGADTLDGGVGADHMIGGKGNDTYHFDNIGDRAVEKAGNGVDTILSSVGLSMDASVENVTLTGVAAINATGNGLNNLMIGNSAANELNGFTGADEMRGGDGNDTYSFDNIGDIVVENANEGIDTIISRKSLTLGANVENLTLIGTASIGTGNGLANLLLGNALGNTLNGAADADEMRGGAGNDLYYVDDVADTVVEGSGNGTDTVNSSVSFTLGAFVENLTLAGSAGIDATGNGQVNILRGNSGSNTLNGGAGADTMRGGAGNDTYVVDNAGDVVVEGGNNGTDTVNSSASFTLGTGVEHLLLTGGSAINGTGNGAANTITGNDAANTLAGAGGADTLIGGGGADNLYGGTGHDDLTGGAGADRFRFDTALSATGNVDDILDFSVADDTIYLDRDIFTGLAADGALAAGAFRAGTTALDADDRILYDSITGHLFYDADGFGATAAILFATVTPGAALTSTDFVGY